MYKIIKNEEEVPNLHRIVIEAPDIAKKAKPGQFIIVMADEFSERIPLTIADSNDNTITVFIVELGISTAKIILTKTGMSLYAVAGPLGMPAILDNYGTVVLGGGCYGISAIYPMAKALKDLGNKIIIIIEARNKYLLYFKKELQSIADEYFEATSDGSAGLKGKVHDVLDRLIKRDYVIDHAKFIGCTYMMMNCSHTTLPYKIPTWVGLNTIMLDGTGMCGCCRVTVDGKTKFACVDGPEFDGHLVNWDELEKRKSSYLESEMISYQKGPHICRTLEQTHLGGCNE